METIIEVINVKFKNTAINFIVGIFQLEKKQIPEYFNSMSDIEILHIYNKTVRELTNKLLQHRQKPIPVEYLDELQYLNSCDVLPKSIKIILESFAKQCI